MTDYTSNQWNRIKSIKPNPGNMVHVSKRFIRNPLARLAEEQNQTFDGPQFVPLPGETYEIGRNERKREARSGLSRKHWPKVA